MGQAADVDLGNLHLNIVAREFKDEIKDTIEPYVYELVGKSLFHLTPAESPVTY